MNLVFVGSTDESQLAHTEFAFFVHSRRRGRRLGRRRSSRALRRPRGEGEGGREGERGRHRRRVTARGRLGLWLRRRRRDNLERDPILQIQAKLKQPKLASESYMSSDTLALAYWPGPPAGSPAGAGARRLGLRARRRQAASVRLASETQLGRGSDWLGVSDE
jgi:hypothetical protein